MEEVVISKGEESIDLPPGFRFHPTDEEIITHYLTRKVSNSGFNAIAIGEVDLNKCEPWDLPAGKAKTGEKESYYFCQRDRKYPTGMRTNRATLAGYWKATGKDREIFRGKGACLVGMKKTLVFYKGRAPKGEKTNWVMHEFRLEGKFSYSNLPKGAKDEWVVCRIVHKSTGLKKSPFMNPHDHLLRKNSFGDDFFDYASLPPLMDSGPSYSDRPGCSYHHLDPHDQNNHQALKSSYINTSLYQHQGLSFQAPNSNFGSYISYPNPNPDGQLQCKVEQFSSNNQSIPSLSQDTGLSTEINNNEISSKHVDQITGTGKSFEDMPDLDTFWADYN